MLIIEYWGLFAEVLREVLSWWTYIMWFRLRFAFFLIVLWTVIVFVRKFGILLVLYLVLFLCLYLMALDVLWLLTWRN